MTDPARKPNVLILEDDEPIRDALNDALDDAGFTTIGVESVLEASTLVAKGDIDAVLVDLRLAHGELGGDFIRSFADDVGSPPMVIVSAARDLAIPLVVEFNLAWLRKPFDIDRVVEAIHKAIRTCARPQTTPAGPAS